MHFALSFRIVELRWGKADFISFPAMTLFMREDIKMFKKTLAALACVIGVAVSGGASADQSETNDPYFGYKPPSTEAAAGIQVFHRCKKCHSMDPSRNTFGPNLRGIYTVSYTSLPRFEYSASLKASGLVWDEANLREWIQGNDIKVEGTRMRHIQITDAAEQDYLIAFLKTFK